MHCKIVFALILIQATWTLCLGRCHQPAGSLLFNNTPTTTPATTTVPPTTVTPTTTPAATTVPPTTVTPTTTPAATTVPPTTVTPTTTPAATTVPPTTVTPTTTPAATTVPPTTVMPTTTPAATTVQPYSHDIPELNYCDPGQYCCSDDRYDVEICCTGVADSGVECQSPSDCGTDNVCSNGLCKCIDGYYKDRTTGNCVESCTLGSTFTYYDSTNIGCNPSVLQFILFQDYKYEEEDYCFTKCLERDDCNAIVMLVENYEQGLCSKVYQCQLYACNMTVDASFYENASYEAYVRDCGPS